MTRAGYSRPHPDSVRDAALGLREAGLTTREIATELGVPQSTIADWLLGIEPKRDCLLCGIVVKGSWGHFCTPRHQQKYRRMYGGVQQTLRAQREAS